MENYKGSICEIVTNKDDVIIADVDYLDTEELILIKRSNGVSLSRLQQGSVVVVHIGRYKKSFLAVRGKLSNVTDEKIKLSDLEIITEQDNRSFARVKVNIKAELSQQEISKKEVKIKDISLGGLCIECDFSLGGVGAKFTIHINSMRNGKQIELKYNCIVVRMLPNVDENKRYGCSFNFSPRDNTDLLWKLIQEQMLLRIK